MSFTRLCQFYICFCSSLYVFVRCTQDTERLQSYHSTDTNTNADTTSFFIVQVYCMLIASRATFWTQTLIAYALVICMNLLNSIRP